MGSWLDRWGPVSALAVCVIALACVWVALTVFRPPMMMESTDGGKSWHPYATVQRMPNGDLLVTPVVPQDKQTTQSKIGKGDLL